MTGAVALGAAVLVAVSGVVPAGALQHRHHRNHRHETPHTSSQPGDLKAARTRKTISQNWSGYVASGGRFTTVSGSWTVPAVNCSSTPNGVVALWVGIDGAGSKTVEQTGTFSACDQGSASYAAWYEAFPASSIILPNPVGPGDNMSATVTNTGPNTFSLVLTNNSRGWTSTNNIQVRGRLASAEAIVEAPSLHGQIVPLADFGSTGFSNVTVNGAPLSSTRGLQPVTMASLGGVVKAVPSVLSGGSFSVSWRHA
ncbi:MAG: hypothetical protein JOZ37_13500 [Actinobacteria bacterium]|nr:hypothetical protein [Actinomycetota bacterium]MBV9254796.1 hypothetical protein [Actinomycetota bacterium]MBV9664977.1 hypothetical protein [Actinomycetota bacterium]